MNVIIEAVKLQGWRYTSDSTLEKNRSNVINAAILAVKLARRNYTCESKLEIGHSSVINAKELVRWNCTSESTLERSRSSVITATFLATPPAVYGDTRWKNTINTLMHKKANQWTILRHGILLELELLQLCKINVQNEKRYIVVILFSWNDQST